jgi:MFS family permease
MGIQKLVQYVLIAVFGSTGATALITGDLADRTVLIGLIVTALGALGTYFTENTPQQPWAKQAVGIFTAAVLIVVSAWTDEQFTSAELVQVILAGLGAWQVGTVANSPAGRLSE